MKNFMKGFIFLHCLAILPSAYAANNNAGDINLSASSLTLSLYKMAVSTSPLCTNLITVIDNGNSPVSVDFLANPDLGSGVLSDGTYNCIVLEFSDVIHFKPSSTSTSGNCLSGVEKFLDICRADSNNGSPGTSKLIDGSTTTCTGTSANSTSNGAGGVGTPGVDRVALYISTASTSSGGIGGNGSDGFNPPTSASDSAHGFKLATPLTITGTSSGKFTINPAGKVCDSYHSTCGNNTSAGTCELAPPLFSFTKI